MISKTRFYYFYVSIPAIILAMAASYYFDAIVGTIVNNPHPQILYAIFMAIIMGIFAIYFSMQRLSKENKIVQKFFEALGKETDTAKLTELAGRGKSSYLLRMIAMSSGRYISSHEYSSMQNELKEIAGRLTSGNALPQFISGLLVGMGLLGTFIGLLSTLKDISVLISGLSNSDVNASAIVVFSRMVEQLRAPMQSMGIAFSASMYGLVGSIITSLMMLGLSRFQSDILSFLTSEVAQHSENSFNYGARVVSSDRSSEMISDLVLARRNDEDTQIFTRIEERIAEMARAQKRLFASESEALQKQRADMMQVLTAQTEASIRVRAEIHGLGDRLESMINTTEKGSNQISGQITELIVQNSAESKDTQVLTRIEEKMAEMTRTQKRLFASESEALQKQRADMMQVFTAQMEESDKVRGKIQGLDERFENIISVIEKGHDSISSQVTELVVHMSAESRETHRLLQYMIEAQHLTNTLLDQNCHNSSSH